MANVVIMKILFISQHYYPEHYTSTLLAEEFAKKGHSVTVVTCSFKGESSNDINGVHVVRLKCYIRKDNKRCSIIKSYLSFWRMSRKWVSHADKSYDVVFSFGTSPVLNLSAGNKYSRRVGVRHIGYILDLWPESVIATGYIKEKSILFQFINLWSKRIYKRIDKIVVGSPSYIDYFQSVIGYKGNDIKYIPQPGFNYVDDHNSYTYNNGKTNIIYFGNITKWQRMDLVLELGKFLESHNSVLHVFGNGSYRDVFKQKIENNNIQGISLYDYVDQITLDKFITGSDFVFVSLTNEGYVGKTIPQKLIQSLTYAKPIIAFIDGDGKDLLNKYECGILPTSYDVSGLKDLFSKALDLDESQKKKLGMNSLICYKENFNIDKISNELLFLFNK